MKYHHLGIPTTVPQPGEAYLEGYKAFCTDHEILIAPNRPSAGVLVAFVICDGAPVEFLEFTEK